MDKGFEHRYQLAVQRFRETFTGPLFPRRDVDSMIAGIERKAEVAFLKEQDRADALAEARGGWACRGSRGSDEE